MRSVLRLLAPAVLGFVLITAVPCRAATISATTVDLVDLIPGQDLWRYSYNLSGNTLNAFEAFDFYFDPNVYGTLSNPATANAGWNLLTLDPDLGIPAPGEFIVQALAGGASTVNPFTVDFVFLGAGHPGSQPFDLLAFDSQGNFVETLGSGLTSLPADATVPEPTTLLLLGSGLAMARAKRNTLRAQLSRVRSIS